MVSRLIIFLYLLTESNSLNVGGLSFTYGLETNDTVGNSYVFNAHDAAWITFARGLFDAAQVMYRNRESAGCFNTNNFLAKVKAYQDTRPERVWVADAQRKYLRPYEDNTTETYLPMLSGRKTHQREQVKTYNAYYYASKYVSDLCTSQNIMVRGNTPTSGTSITVVPPANTATVSMYINCYIVVASTSYNVVAKTRATRGQSYVMDFSSIGSMGETELYFCTAPMITELSGLAHLYFKQNNFSMATNLQRLEIGSPLTGYENQNLEGLTIGNSKMLEYLDVRNCPNATGALDLSGCISLSELYLDNTAFTGVTFAKSGLLEKAHLPAITAIDMRELIYVDDLRISSTANLSKVRIEDCVFDDATELTIGSTTTTHATKDIALNLVDSSPVLSRVRLVGIDWTLSNNNTLDRLIGMAGINDDSFDINQSVLTGSAYVPTMRSSKLAQYNTAWSYLDISYDTIIPQYPVTFMNANGSPILNKLGSAYVQWVDSGVAPYDPVTMGYTISVRGNGTPTETSADATEHNGEYYLDVINGVIYLSNGTTWTHVVDADVLTPSIAETAQYAYTYTGWDDIVNLIYQSKTITATYTSTTKTYTVTWYKTLGVPLEVQTNVAYGSEVNYSGSLPTWTDDEARYTYHLFKGWDKSTGFVRGNIDVYAVWDSCSGLPAAGTDMKDMTLSQIYGIGQAGQQDQYFEDLDYFQIEFGHDCNFSNVQDCEIGTDVTLTGIAVDQYVSGGYYFDGSHAYTTNIKLFDEDSPAFTMAIDFQFNSSSNGQTLVSCHNGSTAEGFRLYWNGTGPAIQWGDRSVVVGGRNYRDIVVIRHPQNSKYLYIYSAGSDSPNYSLEVTKSILLRSSATQTSEPLSFGGVHYPGSGYRDYGKGTIHWCKIWYDDIGEHNAYNLAYWPHEKYQFEYYGPNQYWYSGTSETTKCSFVCNTTLDTTGDSYYYGAKGSAINPMNGSGNEGGWKESRTRELLNNRLYKGLPFELQSAIKTVDIKANEGNRSTNVVTTEDKVYLLSLRENGALTNAVSYYDVYANEIGASDHSVPWLRLNASRWKNRGIVRTYIDPYYDYLSNQEPSALYQTDIEPGAVWGDTSANVNSPSVRVFVPQDRIDQYGISNYTAADPNYAQGGWVSCMIYWTRSAVVTSTTNYWRIGTTGAPGSDSVTSGYVYGVVPCFSF